MRSAGHAGSMTVSRQDMPAWPRHERMKPPSCAGVLVRPDRERADRDRRGNCCPDLTQLASASLTAACSLAAFSPRPGRPAAPTATAFQPLDASASLRATSSRASAERSSALPAALKKPVIFSDGRHRHHKTSSSATIMQGTPAIAPQDSRATPRRFLHGLGADVEEERAAGAERDRLGLARRRIHGSRAAPCRLARQRHVPSATNGCSVDGSCLIQGSGGIGGLPCGINDGIADRVEFAFARRLRGIRALLALLDRGRSSLPPRSAGR